VKVNVSQIVEGKTHSIPLDFQFNMDNADEMIKEFQIVNMSPFHFQGEIFRNADKIFLQLDFKGEITFKCSRCTENVSKVITGTLDTEIISAAEEENGDGLYLKGDILDLREVLLEGITLALPMKILCREDCKGLCPNCGVNLNIKECSCKTEKIDPRLEKLKYFFSDDKEV